jgi:chemotaxis signal transduction protein
MINGAFDGVIFRLNGMSFAIDALKVREVVGGAVWKVAEGDGETQRYIQARGRVIPVVDLRQLFSFPSLEKNGMNSFIAVQLPGAEASQLVALWVDSLLEMVHVPAGELMAISDDVEGLPVRFLQAVMVKDGEKVFIIRTDEILNEKFSNEKELDMAAS